MNFTENIATGVNTVANGIFGTLETKEKAQNVMLEMIMLSCKQYQNDEHFRRWINHAGDRKNHRKFDKDQKKPEKMR
jgi:hypothetical protein